jgi:ABC-type lipoprotein export system ATPase subunit
MMELRDVTKVYVQGRRTVHAVRGVSLTVAAGEFVSIMGPSGSGKSTLMHLMGGLDTPTTGEAIFHGKNLAAMSDRERSRRAGFQRHLTKPVDPAHLLATILELCPPAPRRE